MSDRLITEFLELVDTPQEMVDISTIASIVWPFAYKNILSQEQIKYMLDKFLSVDAIEKAIEDGYRFVLLIDDDKVKMGFISYKFEDDEIFLSKVYILPNFQNKGLLKEVIANLAQFKQNIRLTVNKHNTNAIKAYEHLGFKRIKSVKTDIGNGFYMDDYVMLLEVK